MSIWQGKYPDQDYFMSLANCWQVVLKCKLAGLKTSRHDWTASFSLQNHLKQCKATIQNIQQACVCVCVPACFHIFVKMKSSSHLGCLILKSISPPTGQPHATLPFTCQSLTRSWQAPPKGTFCHIWHSLPINNLHAKQKSLYDKLWRWVSTRPHSSTEFIFVLHVWQKCMVNFLKNNPNSYIQHCM